MTEISEMWDDGNTAVPFHTVPESRRHFYRGFDAGHRGRPHQDRIWLPQRARGEVQPIPADRRPARRAGEVRRAGSVPPLNR